MKTNTMDPTDYPTVKYTDMKVHEQLRGGHPKCPECGSNNFGPGPNYDNLRWIGCYDCGHGFKSKTTPPKDESVGDIMQARKRAEDRIAAALAHIAKDLDTLNMELGSGKHVGIDQAIGMLTDLKEILTK